ncbi:unnamed protein product [Periconia digitata]|uniref:Rhodopsin domain-containing protein n=1 Tax=Periconia digitata TaxID=1303443 RepID=A0A9W4XXI0_9PLEO|nr:unnamed protein product [Periconia digitata]
MRVFPKALYVAGYQPLLYLMSDINSGIAHRSYVPLERFSLIRYYMHVLYILYGLIILAIKSAIIIQCTRILTPLGARTSAYWIFQILLCAHIIVYSTNTFAEIFICSPRAKAWDYTVTNGHCMDIDAVHIASAAVNTASDLLLVIVSQSIIWRMHIPVRRRWAVSSVFLVGLLACVAAIIRMYYTILFARNKNNMRIAIKLSTWVNVEICCGFLVACMPGLPRFFKHPPIASIWIPIVRFLRRSEHSGPTELANAGSKSSDGQAPRSDVLVTDIEFEELVRRTDSDVTLNAN